MKITEEMVGEADSSIEKSDGKSIASKMPLRVNVIQGLELSHVSGPKQPQSVIPRANTPYKYIKETAHKKDIEAHVTCLG